MWCPYVHADRIKNTKEKTPIRTGSMFTQVWLRVRCGLRLWVGGLLKSWIHPPLHVFRILHVSACLWLPHSQRGSIDMRLSLLWFQICEQSRCVFKSLNFGMGWCIARVVCNRKLGNMLTYSFKCSKIFCVWIKHFFFLKMLFLKLFCRIWYISKHSLWRYLCETLDVCRISVPKEAKILLWNRDGICLSTCQ